MGAVKFGAEVKICSKRTTCAVLASGVVISLTALTGGVAPAFAKPGDEPTVPTTTVVAPEPKAAPEQEQEPAQRPTAAEGPSSLPTATAPTALAPTVAPAPVEPSAEPPVQTRTARPEPSAEPEPSVEPPVPTRSPQPTTSTTNAPTTTTAPTTSTAPSQARQLAPSDTPTSTASPAPSAAAVPSATPTTSGEPTPQSSTTPARPGDESTSSSSESSSTESSNPESSSTESGNPESSTSGSRPTESGTSGSATSSEPSVERVIERVEPKTLEAPDEDVQLAKSAKVVEEKPAETPASDIQGIATLIDLPNRDRNLFAQNGLRPDDQVRLAGDRRWDQNVRQWRPDWVEYDEYYRPVLSNPYRDPVRIVYIYENRPRISFIPPLGRIVLEVAQFAAYSFTAVVTNAVNTAVNVAVGSFFGGGFFPGVGLPLPLPPPALVNYSNVPVQVRYPDATYQPFRVNKIIDVGDDAQYGERKVLLDGVTPAWGQWRNMPSGERSFEVHKTQQFPGLDDPRPGPLPGDYQLTLAADETASGMTNRDVYLIAVAVACGALSIGAVVLAVMMGRRRRPLH